MSNETKLIEMSIGDIISNERDIAHGCYTKIMRVVDGWIYYFEQKRAGTLSVTSTFVPLPRKEEEKIIQVSGFGVENTHLTQCNYMLTAVTNKGNVLMSNSGGEWHNITDNKKWENNEQL